MVAACSNEARKGQSMGKKIQHPHLEVFQPQVLVIHGNH